MSCRIGITTNVDDRKKYWKSRHTDLRNWETLETYQTKTEAQNAENRLSSSHGCVSHPGGGGNEYGTWYVYKFDY